MISLAREWSPFNTRRKVRGRVVDPVDYSYWVVDTPAACRTLTTGVVGCGQNAGIVEDASGGNGDLLVREHLDYPWQMREPARGYEVQVGPPLSDFRDIRHPDDPIDLAGPSG